jgi:mono/diheme cytochrome c family protein
MNAPAATVHGRRESGMGKRIGWAAEHAPGRGRFGRAAALGGAAALAAMLAAPAVAQEGTGAPGADLVTKGKYLTEAADCMPCHTGPGGQPFAGGLTLNTPFGGITSPNITPDKETGIGAWTDEQFYRALHDGFGKDGEYLYPAMPFTSYTKMPVEDVKAIRAYLATVTPVNAPRQPNTLEFPFNVRSSLAVWRAMFFTPGTFVPNDKASEAINRGAYLVEGPGHCAECHTPRNLMGAMEPSKQYAGARIDTFFAPNISSDLRDGIGGWTDDQVFDYLKTGAASGKGTVFGPMSEVVHDSLSKLEDSDIRAIVAYLKATPDELPPKPAADPRKAEGATVYLNVCAQCHQAEGTGIAKAIPPLAGNDAAAATGPENVISAVLGGLPGQGDYGPMPAFADALTDQQVADVANYVRTAWGNPGTPDATPALVASLRGKLATTDLGSEAAKALDCPAVSSTGAAGTLSDPGTGILELMRGVTPDSLDQRVNEIIAQVRAANPGVSNDELSDDLVAAYCPILATDAQLSFDQKQTRLSAFLSSVTNILAQGQMPTGAKILLQVGLPQQVIDDVEAAARAAKENRDDWIAKALETAVKAAPKPAQ